jgi:anti-sigma B factor antagonist
LQGRLGVTSSSILTAEVAAAVSAGHFRLVIDLEGVDYVSSAGLVALSETRSRLGAHDGSLVLCHLPEPVRRAIELAGLLESFSIEPTRERAIASCRKVDGVRNAIDP